MRTLLNALAHRRSTPILLCALLASIPAPGNATLITGTFTGDVYASGFSSGGTVPSPGYIPIGSTVTGQFSYDTTAIPPNLHADDPTIGAGLYQFTGGAARLSLTANGVSWSSGPDVYAYTAFSPSNFFQMGAYQPLTSPAGAWTSAIDMQFLNNPYKSTTGLISSLALPTSASQFSVDPVWGTGSGTVIYSYGGINSNISFNVVPGSLRIVDSSLPPPPTTLELGEFSDLTYGTQDKVVPAGYSILRRPSTGNPYEISVSGGYGVAYSDGANIVIAFKGTNDIKDIVSDASWSALNTPSDALKNYIEASAKMVKTVLDENPGKNVVLTGHSLGGAVAQAVGAVSGLHTETFNAPGMLYLLPQLTAQLGAFQSTSAIHDIINHRVEGDVVSTAGKEIGSVVTHSDPSDTSLLNKLGSGGVASAYYYHKMNTILAAITNDISGKPDYPDNLLTKLGNVLLLTTGETISTIIDILQFYKLDPVATLGQEFDLSPGSPHFQSIAFGYPGDFRYLLEELTNGLWTKDGIFSPGDIYSFGDLGADAFRVYALDPFGSYIPIPEYFSVAVSFNQAGTATITYNDINSIPEPSSFALFGAALIALIFSLRHRGLNKINPAIYRL